ncbi:MAG: hypothetical protein U0792_18155 [Gemmataceae bacterium]
MLSRHTTRAGRGVELIIALVAALGAGGAAGYMIATSTSTPSTTTEPTTPKTDRVTALGRLQPAGGVVPVYGPPGDRIAKMHDVKLGDHLKVGTPIAELCQPQGPASGTPDCRDTANGGEDVAQVRGTGRKAESARG